MTQSAEVLKILKNVTLWTKEKKEIAKSEGNKSK